MTNEEVGSSAAARRTSGVAIASLVLGVVGMLLCGLGFLPGMAALILGIVALTQIGRNRAELGGAGMAIAGIVMGGASILLVPFVAIVAAIAIPSLMGARITSNEAMAAAHLRTCCGAQNMYRRSDYDGDEVLEYAYPYVKLYAEDTDGRPIRLIDDALANASSNDAPSGVTMPKAGYVYVDLVGDEGGEDYDDGKGNFVTGFGLCAVPANYGRTGRNTYVIDIQGTVYQQDNGGEALTRFPDTAEGWIPVGGY